MSLGWRIEPGKGRKREFSLAEERLGKPEGFPRSQRRRSIPVFINHLKNKLEYKKGSRRDLPLREPFRRD